MGGCWGEGWIRKTRGPRIYYGAAWLLFALLLRRISSSGESRLKFLACSLERARMRARPAASLVLRYCYTERLRQTTADRCKLLKRTAYRGSYSEKRAENGERPFIFVGVFRARVCFATNRRCFGEYIFRQNCCPCRFTDCSSLFTSFNFPFIAARFQSRESFNPFTLALCPEKREKIKQRRKKKRSFKLKVNSRGILFPFFSHRSHSRLLFN